jgi:thymidylate synthase (FAD)
MKLIRPFYEILTPINGNEILKTIEKVARTCYKSEDKITEDSARKMVQTLISRGHEAMIEFYDVTVKFVCDRGISHEIVRHRIASFAQESTRYCNYAKDKFNNQITFIIPCWISDDQINLVQRMNEQNFMKIDEGVKSWYFSLNQSQNSYNLLIKLGWQPQQARTVLPNSLKTEINVKFNLREWKHFFRLRCSTAAHPQMRELTIPLLKELKLKIPIIFDDIII